MSDHEPTGFKVVDRRQAVMENAANSGDAAPQAPSQTASTLDITVDEQTAQNSESAAEPLPETEDSGSWDSEADERGMPDPALLLSIAAMQLDVQTLARLLVPIFDGQAWRAMGFLADPKTGETQKDLSSAQLAIDCVQFLLSKVDVLLSDSERHEMQRRLNDLRMNYLGKLREG